jgi:MinD superfamily P-loop ATPase
MTRIVFLSGKGGTGKTTLAAAFAMLTEDLVIVDADVDAANLHLVFSPTSVERGVYRGSKAAEKDPAACTLCARCVDVCRFDAIDEACEVDPLRCEGCGACVTVCPENALRLVERESGEWYRGETSWGPIVGAELAAGEETSGKLVSLVKRLGDELAEANESRWQGIDGAPGIGCPVIASATGADVAVLVTEPSCSGLHDLERILGVVKHFGIRAFVVINKADLNTHLAEEIEAFADKNEVPALGRIPYDHRVTNALRSGRSVVQDSTSPAGHSIRRIIERVKAETGHPRDGRSSDG